MRALAASWVNGDQLLLSLRTPDVGVLVIEPLSAHAGVHGHVDAAAIRRPPGSIVQKLSARHRIARMHYRVAFSSRYMYER
jgi:hypothetical protein